MPIPALDDAGLLPAGVHDCTLEEVRPYFGTFQTTDRRPKLYDKLQLFVREAWATGLVIEILLDGSFVTSKPYAEYLEFFAQVRGETSHRKGLLRLRHDQK